MLLQSRHSRIREFEGFRLIGYRYQKSMIAYAFKDEPRYRNCLRINCSNGQLHETGDAEPLMTCSICEYKMCYVLSRPWHEGQTCTQYDNSLQKRAEEQASMQLLARLSKPCPGPGCRILIMKDLGCDHMTCKSAIPTSYKTIYLPKKNNRH